MRIAIFDYKVTRQSPVGSCHFYLLRALCHTHDFTVFAAEFENPSPARIRWVRIPCPMRPLALSYISFHLLAPIFYLSHRLRHRTAFDLVQMVESNLLFGDICYAQFCHRAYLREHGLRSGYGGLRSGYGGLRVWLRWLDHWLHALAEPIVFRRVRHIVAASQGLRRELTREYPGTAVKICVLPNPVSVEELTPPSVEDRARIRAGMGILDDEFVTVFVALGHFERKGLPLLIDAMRAPSPDSLRLLVVGGETDLVAAYERRVQRLGLNDRIRFVGMKRDVRPYWWAADACALPSSYEVFPLVALQAAAAGLPLMVTPLYGVEEFARDGENVVLIQGTVEGVRSGLATLLALTPAQRQQMGVEARRAVAAYSTDNFVERWRCFYDRLQENAQARAPTASQRAF